MDEFTKATAREMNDAEWLRRASRAAHQNAADAEQENLYRCWLKMSLLCHEIIAHKAVCEQARDQLRNFGIEVDP